MPIANERRLLAQSVWRDCSRAFASAGKSSATSTAMIARTTGNSTRVKPLRDMAASRVIGNTTAGKCERLYPHRDQRSSNIVEGANVAVAETDRPGPLLPPAEGAVHQPPRLKAEGRE